VKIAIVFAIHPHVAVFACADGVTRMVHVPTGMMLIAAPWPVNIPQLTHEFALEAAKRNGAQIG
jgi:hypothetical protein